ncbi:hypothetical protein HK405_005922 [Cladochytrium tenue]|nr:hypothetical protein HK405_005922 [Cladochytrium tenue]
MSRHCHHHQGASAQNEASAALSNSHSGAALQAVAVIDGWAALGPAAGANGARRYRAARELPFCVLLDDDYVPFLLLDNLSADPPLDVNRANAALRDFMSLPQALEAGLLDRRRRDDSVGGLET